MPSMPARRYSSPPRRAATSVSTGGGTASGTPALEAAGPYHLRHTFATEALAAGVSIFEHARLIGGVKEAAKVGALHGVHHPESGGGGTKRFRPVPTLGALAHHVEKVAQSLAVDVDLDVVAQRGGRVVEGDVDFAELGAEVLR
jgi:hypothetical protein